MKKIVYAAAAFFAAAAAGAVLLNTLPFNPFGPDDGKRKQIAQGQLLYGARCATCHGKNLEGQPNWRTPLPSGKMPAPPHDKTGHSWHHPDDVLAGVIKFGLKPYAGKDYESDMPAFGTMLRDDEIAAIVAYIKSTWPERERAYQEQMTLQSKLISTPK